MSLNKSTNGSEEFSCDMNNTAGEVLQSGTTYYYMAFAQATDGTMVYGAVSSFDTQEDYVSVDTGGVTEITQTNAVIKYYVEGTTRNSGFFIDTSKSQVQDKTADYVELNKSTTTPTELTCDMYANAGQELQAGTTYYIMAFAQAVDGMMYYGDISSFTTAEQKPAEPSATMETRDTVSITSTNAKIRGYVTGDVLNSGFYYGTSKSAVQNKTSDMIGFNVRTDYPHYMTCDMNKEAGLTLSASTTYYYMAYTQAADGNTYYGSVESFTTTR